jgi:hypothetical protein
VGCSQKYVDENLVDRKGGFGEYEASDADLDDRRLAFL